ncbi:MAG: hypothetical protein IJ565_00215 [Bacilli bacterium]|nr:hypothetical protein [Bacilli bacterium]
MDKLEEIFDEVIEEANDGIKYNGINIKFHTLDKCILNGAFSDIPVLIIRNKRETINKLKTYIDLVLKQKKLDPSRSNIKKCVALLWSNACFEDFSKPTVFIDNRINFYINDDFLKHEKEIDNIVIKKNIESIYKETPYAFKAYIKIDNDKYYLPSINYGISNDTCYIYKLTNHDNDIKLSRKIESKYDVNLLTLSLLTKELYNYGIGKIKVVSCLPMRDTNESAKNILDDFTSMGNLFNNIIISSIPFECDEYMNIDVYKFDGKSKTNFNELLIDKE